MDPQALASVLQEAGIQVDKKNLENPTESFLIYLTMQYLIKFNFDAHEISNSTREELECFSHPDLALDAITVINLFSALKSICEEIFLPDFSLTDITSPGPKRTRKQIKMLFNFFAYVKNKMTENKVAVNQLEILEQNIKDMIVEKDNALIKIGETISEQENKLAVQQHIQKIKDETSLEIKNCNEKSKKLDDQLKEIMLKHQEATRRHSELHTKARKLHDITKELEGKIVKSPEEYASKSKELQSILELKKEERQILNDCITKKKVQIKNNEVAHKLVKDLNEKFADNGCKTMKKLKETVAKLDVVNKKLGVVEADIAKWSKDDLNNIKSSTKNDNFHGHEQLLHEFDSHIIDKERELNIQKTCLEKLKIELNEKKGLLEKEIKSKVLAEKKYSNLVVTYQNTFEKEMAKEQDLRNAIGEMF